MADREINQLLRAYLMTLYGVTNQDTTTLVQRYLDASTLVERTNAYQALIVLASA